MPPSGSTVASPRALASPTSAHANAMEGGAAVYDASSPRSPSAGQKVRVRINDFWYDLTAWQNQHPGGAAILHQMNGKDATDAFTAIHSDEAHGRLSRLNRTPTTAADDVNTPGETIAFRQFRAQLVKDGFWVRQPLWELWLIVMVWALMAGGTYLALCTNQKLLAIAVLGLGMQQSGWTGHDYQHGRGGFCWWVGHFTAGCINAFSPTWWSGKHNTHHVFPNFHGTDEDIANDPIFHLWIPVKDKDVFIRKYQAYYFLPVCAFLYLSWRWQSIKTAWARKDAFELTLMAVNYTYLVLVLPWIVSIGSVLFGGFLVGVVVTATHQSEQMTTADEQPVYNWVRHQFDSTRDADTTGNPLMHYLWGGMQYQLEHHLFPTLPRYRYTELSRRVQEFAKANGLDYRTESVWAIWYRTLSTMHHYGTSAPIDAVPPARM